MLESTWKRILALRGDQMRTIGLLGLLFLAGAVLAQAPSNYQPVASMSQLMVNIIYPTSNAIFNVQREAPRNEKEWIELQNSAMMLAESGNLLMMPTRARDQGDWVKDAKAMVDVGLDAYKAAMAHDPDTLVKLNVALNDSCVNCHTAYRPNYGRRKQQQQEQAPPKQ